jgi:hypothetical protein
MMFAEAKTENKICRKAKKNFFYVGEPLPSPPFLAPMFTGNKRTKTK